MLTLADSARASTASLSIGKYWDATEWIKKNDNEIFPGKKKIKKKFAI